MLEPLGAAPDPQIEQRLQRYKRPIYAVILCIIAVQVVVALPDLDASPLQASSRYIVAGLALLMAAAFVFAPRLFRPLEVSVVIAGGLGSLLFLSLSMGDSALNQAGAIRYFTIWLALFVVWAFLALRSRTALGLSALLLALGVVRVALQLATVGPSANRSLEFGALTELLVVGASYVMLLFALTNSVERRSAALASEETAARILAVDSLTGMINRATFHRLHQELTRGRQDAPFSLMLVDVDDFRSINERFGTSVGDDVLRDAALRLANAVGQDARVLARLGGDVFGLLFDGELSEEQTAELASRVSRAFQAPFMAGGGPLQVTATVGVSRYPEDAHTQTEQVSQAEFAVERAKEKGKPFGLASLNVSEQESVALLRDLREALGRGELELVFQPIATVVGSNRQERDCATVSVRTVETLLRWHHPERGVLQPQEFIPLAESAGLIPAIGSWVLNEACRQAINWERQQRGEFNVSVNVSPHQFTEPGLVETISRALSSSGLAPGRLLIEITETSADQPAVEQRLAEIRELGVRVAIDDFGSGYSSLGRLRSIPIDFVKLDRSFVRGLDGDDVRARLIVRAAVVLAHGLGAKVIAEGIESQPQAMAAVDVGCDYLQGFLIDSPKPAARFASSWRSGDELHWCEGNGAPSDAGVAARLN